MDHWPVCSGRGGEGLCLPLCHCQCVSGERLTTIVFLSLKCMYIKLMARVLVILQPLHSAIVLQGLFIFLFHVVRHEKVYGKIKDQLPKLWTQVSTMYCHILVQCLIYTNGYH